MAKSGLNGRNYGILWFSALAGNRFCVFLHFFFPKIITMKRIITIIFCLLFVNVCFSQNNGGLFQRMRNHFIVHDTIYIYEHVAEPDTIVGQGDEDEPNDDDEEGDELSESIPMPVDTLNTEDRYQKVVLFDNGTWLYYNLDKPQIPDSLDDDHWLTERVHSYYDVALKDLPDEVELRLVDSVHSYCIPHPGYVTSRFKFRKKRPHKGVDIGVNMGDAIYAAFDGVVRVAMETNMSGGYGNVLVIRHLNGLETYYGHLSSFIVESGDVVRAGELIGYGGSTGRSTGPHLHFETRYMGQAFDPERIFDLERGTLRSETFTLKKHYFNINSHYGMTDQQSIAASKKAPKDPSVKKSGTRTYTVRKGDTLSKISKRYGISVAQLCKMNGFKKNKVLRVGQKIRVPNR